MDKLDRMLRDLPREDVPPELAVSIGLAVHRRHRRRQLMRRAGAAVLAVLGVWLLWPGLLWLSSNELYASSAPWLTGGLQYLNEESLAMLSRLWNAMFAVQGTISSSVAVSIVVGALLMCGSIFLAIDIASWQPPFRQSKSAASSGMLSSGLHL